LIQYIQKLKKSLIEKTGGIGEDGKYKGAKEEEKVAQYMLGSGDTQNGEGYTLQKKLDAYTLSLNAIMKTSKIGKEFNKMALDAKDDPMFAKDSDQRKKSFAQINFEGTPLVAALAVLSEKESSLRAIEKEALGLLSEKIGGEIIPVDRVRPVVLSKSQYVVAGLKYEADLFMAAYSSSFKPQMTYNGNSLAVDGEGAGKIDFRASGGGYNADGIARKIWKGTISYPKSGGGDSLYQIEQEYFVVRPTIEVKAAAVEVLYRNCGNEIDIQVPALGAEYNPSFSITGGRLIPKPQKGKVVIVPTGNRVKIGVANNGSHIGDKKYRVTSLPKSIVVITVDGRPIDPIRGITKSQLSRLRIKIKPDPSVASLLPRDTRYYIDECTVTLAGGRVSKGSVSFDGHNTQPLRRFVNTISPNSNLRVVIEVKKIVRKNYLNQRVPVRMPVTIQQAVIR